MAADRYRPSGNSSFPATPSGPSRRGYRVREEERRRRRQDDERREWEIREEQRRAYQGSQAGRNWSRSRSPSPRYNYRPVRRDPYQEREHRYREEERYNRRPERRGYLPEREQRHRETERPRAERNLQRPVTQDQSPRQSTSTQATANNSSPAAPIIHQRHDPSQKQTLASSRSNVQIPEPAAVRQQSQHQSDSTRSHQEALVAGPVRQQSPERLLFVQQSPESPATDPDPKQNTQASTPIESVPAAPTSSFATTRSRPVGTSTSANTQAVSQTRSPSIHTQAVSQTRSTVPAPTRPIATNTASARTRPVTTTTTARSVSTSTARSRAPPVATSTARTTQAVSQTTSGNTASDQDSEDQATYITVHQATLRAFRDHANYIRGGDPNSAGYAMRLRNLQDLLYSIRNTFNDAYVRYDIPSIGRSLESITRLQGFFRNSLAGALLRPPRFLALLRTVERILQDHVQD